MTLFQIVNSKFFSIINLYSITYILELVLVILLVLVL